ncbi:MAG: M1 family aminopeptidase [Archangium sp.]
MRSFVLASMVAALPALSAELAPEAQIALTSLRSGERARVEAVLGDATELPLYRGDFTVDVKTKTVTGRVAISLPAKLVSNELFLRCTPNANHPGAVVLSKAKVNGAAVTLSQPDPSLYKVKVEPGAAVMLELELKARIPVAKPADVQHSLDAPGGDYGAFSAGEDAFSLIGLMPMIPPERRGQLFEGPSGIGDLGTFAPSNFVVSVTAPTTWRVVANGQALGEVPTGAGTVKFSYAVAAARDLPLLMLKRPTVLTKRAGEVDVEVVLLTTDKRRAERVLQVSAELLAVFEQKLGPYPFKTLRVVEQRLHGGAGGMEFPGLITVSSALASGELDPFEQLGLGGDSSQLLKGLLGTSIKELISQTLDFTIAHELAHQYTAMLVGNDPIAEPIADEPLTQHLALLALEWNGAKKAAQSMRDNQLKGAYQLTRMMGGSDGVAERATHEYQSNREYAVLMYGKAPMLFDELRKLVGNEAWERMLKRYVEENRYRWVTGRTFTDLVGRESRQQSRVEALRKRWWQEKHGDEDIGQVDLDAMMNGKGGGGLQGIDPALMKQMEDVMKALSGE